MLNKYELPVTRKDKHFASVTLINYNQCIVYSVVPDTSGDAKSVAKSVTSRLHFQAIKF